MLDLSNIEKCHFASLFPEISDIECEYPDCTHMPKENGCLAPEKMSPSRLESYRKLFEEGA